MKYLPVVLIISTLFIFSCDNDQTTPGPISTETLLEELISLERLSYFPDNKYRTVQFSSYDRRSTVSGRPGWFSNSDGFGAEPVPGFLETLTEPDSTGIGEYLVCDIRGPGAIVRTWTARINGELDVYLDNKNKPVYSGNAEKFLWNTAWALDTDNDSSFLESVFRQNDACYFPIPFSKGCRIVWRGDINQLHFYHIQMRLYNDNTEIRSFSRDDIDNAAGLIEKIAGIFNYPGSEISVNGKVVSGELVIPAGEAGIVDTLSGTWQITRLAFRIKSGEINTGLRKNILNIFFDDSSIPQVHTPLGDFFGAAPGINPYSSLPFTVNENGLMICRFPMPFEQKALIMIENRSDEDMHLLYSCRFENYEWIEGRSMHFRAKWRIDREMTASNVDIQDIPYILVKGKGRFVGVAAFIKNPSSVPSSWGNWWGEGDEKIFVDDDISPSVFGTGSEDYFNYSWSSSALFDHMYCGQPRNDGPANRGFVTNYRYQVIDDIVFNSGFAFFMELCHHGIVHDFDYGRICYYYAPPETFDDNMRISDADIGMQSMPNWDAPGKYLGSSGYEFIEAEDIVSLYPADRLFYDYLWSGGRAFFNTFSSKGDSFELRFSISEAGEKSVQLTLAHTPLSGKVKIYIKGLEEQTAVEADLKSDYRILSRNHSLRRTELQPGNYSVIIENLEDGTNRVGVDFIWI
ncbi:MAG: DUF2961 domain-containing protein [Bacteroidales bacterium]|nr:DUF2961 domain-containing protein [Bacteroidales bacterium]